MEDTEVFKIRKTGCGNVQFCMWLYSQLNKSNKLCSLGSNTGHNLNFLCKDLNEKPMKDVMKFMNILFARMKDGKLVRRLYPLIANTEQD